MLPNKASRKSTGMVPNPGRAPGYAARPTPLRFGDCSGTARRGIPHSGRTPSRMLRERKSLGGALEVIPP